MYLSEDLQKKWGPVLDHEDLPKIKDHYRRAVTAVLLENQEKSMREQADSGGMFGNLSEAVTSEIAETDETIEVTDEKQEVRLDENMKHYTSAIKRYNS